MSTVETMTDGVSAYHLGLLDELRTDDSPHSKRTLRTHLLGTLQYLRDWGLDEPVAVAGLFHSIYGTQSYTRQSTSLDDRHEMRARMGERAERLAWQFCVADPGGFFYEVDKRSPRLWNHIEHRLFETTAEDLKDLIDVEIANLIQQVDPEQVNPRAVGRLRPMLVGGDTYLCDGARLALADFIAVIEARAT